MEKYTNVRFNVQRIVRLRKGGHNIADIARALGFPENCGQNRVTNALVKAGLWKVHRRSKKRSRKAAH